MSDIEPKSKPKVSDAKIIKIEPLSPTQAHWTKLLLTTYTDPLSHERTWEHAARATRPPNSAIDGVGVVAILPSSNNPTSTTGKNDKGPEIILQKQFRPPLGKVVIEIPAGLVDEGEGAKESAVRELREETGFVGTVLGDGVSPVMFNDPGFCTTNLQMVHVSIDPSLPANRPENLKPELEENEFIEVFTCPLRELYGECKRLEREEGYAIDARVGTLAEGIEMARVWKLW